MPSRRCSTIANETSPPNDSKIFKLTSGLSKSMLLRHKVCTKLLLYCHLPIKVPFSIIISQKGRYGKLNFSIRIIGYTILITLLVVVVVVVSTPIPCVLRRRRWRSRASRVAASSILPLSSYTCPHLDCSVDEPPAHRSYQ